MCKLFILFGYAKKIFTKCDFRFMMYCGNFEIPLNFDIHKFIMKGLDKDNE